MPSAGSITFDAKLNTNGIQKQLTDLGKTIVKLNAKISTTGIKKQLNEISKNGGFKIKAQVDVNAANIKSQLSKISKTNKFYIKADVQLNPQSIQKELNKVSKASGNNMKLTIPNTRYTSKTINETVNGVKRCKKVFQETTKEVVNMNGKLVEVQNTVRRVEDDAKKGTSDMVLNLAGQLTNTLSSGSGSLIQGFTAALSTIGGMLGTALSGGNAAVGSTVGKVISIIGNAVGIVINLVKGAINIAIKLVKGFVNLIKKSVEIIKNMFTFLTKLPGMITTVISKLANFSLVFKGLNTVINYCKNTLSQLISMLGYKFNAYSIVNFVKEAFDLGSSITEQQHVLEVVIPEYMALQEELDNTSRYMKYMEDVTERLGISQINATKYMSGYASMWKSLGITSNEAIIEMSENMLQLTSDIASFKDMDYEDVFSSLRSTIFGGQTRTGLNMGTDVYVESLKKYLDNLNVTIDDSDTAMEKYCASMNKTWETMTAAEKSVTRLNKIMNDLNFMAKDFTKTSYTWANQTRLLKEQFSNLKAVVGENLIMLFNNLLIIINKIIGAMNVLANAFNRFLKALGLGYALGNGNDISSALGDETDAFNDAADSIGDASSNAASKIQRSLLPFDKLMNKLSSNDKGGSGSSNSNGGGLLGSVDNSEGMVEETETLVTKAINVLKNSFKRVSTFFSQLWKDFKTNFVNPFATYLQSDKGIAKFLNNIADLINNIDFDKIGYSFSRMFESMVPVAETLWNIGISIQENFINPLVEFVSNEIVPRIVDAFTKFNNSVDWKIVESSMTKILNSITPIVEGMISLGTTIWTNVISPLTQTFLNDGLPKITSFIEEFSRMASVDMMILEDRIKNPKKFNNMSMYHNPSISTINAMQPMEMPASYVKQNSSILAQYIGLLLDEAMKMITSLDEQFGISEAMAKIVTFAIDSIIRLFENSQVTSALSKLVNKFLDFIFEVLNNQEVLDRLGNIIINFMEWLRKLDETYGISQLIVETLVKAIQKALGIISEGTQIVGESIGENISKNHEDVEVGLKFLKGYGKVNDFLSGLLFFGNTNYESLPTKLVNWFVDDFLNFDKTPIQDQISKSTADFYNNTLAIDTTPIQDKLAISTNSYIDNIFVKADTTKVQNSLTSKVSNFFNSLFKPKTSGVMVASAGTMVSNIPAFANGGYVKATPGGSIVRVSEAGQSEHIVGDKKLRETVQDAVGGQRPIILQLDGETLGTWMLDFINGESYRLNGVTLI